MGAVGTGAVDAARLGLLRFQRAVVLLDDVLGVLDGDVGAVREEFEAVVADDESGAGGDAESLGGLEEAVADELELPVGVGGERLSSAAGAGGDGAPVAVGSEGVVADGDAAGAAALHPLVFG